MYFTEVPPVERRNVSKALNLSLFILVLLGILYLLMKISPWIGIFFSFIRAVFGPFLIAMIISYLLNPVVNLLSVRLLPRSLAVLFIYSLFIASIVILIIIMVPHLEAQLNELVEHLPEWNARVQAMIKEYNDHSREVLPMGIQAGIEKSLARLETKVSDYVGNMMSGIGSTINQLFLLFIIPFLAFYMMKDIHSIERTFLFLLPKNKRHETISVLREMDQALGNYIRGQFLVCLVVGILAYIGYLIVGLPYALLLAALVAVFNVIPYLGPIFGAIPAIFVAFISESPRMALGVLIVNLIIQILEGNVISPQIVGKSLHMHPLFIIFALLVGGQVGGVLGLILAVPLFAMGKVVLEHVVNHFIQRRV
jgi:sporulation integral membrane protein YtvI